MRGSNSQTDQTPLRLLSLMKFSKDLSGESKLLKAALNTEDFYFWERTTIKEAATFVSRLVVDRTKQGLVSVNTDGSKEKMFESDVLREFVVHAWVQDARAVCLIASREYPKRLCLEVLKRAFAGGEDLEAIAKEFDYPEKTDQLLRVKSQVDETKNMMLENIDALLARGDSIEVLLSKTDDLSWSSKVFAENAESLNSCWHRCTIL